MYRQIHEFTCDGEHETPVIETIVVTSDSIGDPLVTLGTMGWRRTWGHWALQIEPKYWCPNCRVEQEKNES